DPQGKLSQAVLLALLEGTPERAAVREPVVLSEEGSAGRLVGELRVPAELAFLGGHFPGRPLGAGVGQLHWAVQAARELVGPGVRIAALSGVRFRDVLLPEQCFTLEVELAPDGASVRFRAFDGERVFASGRAALAREDAP